MKKGYIWVMAVGIAVVMAGMSCHHKNEPAQVPEPEEEPEEEVVETKMMQIDSIGWYWQNKCPIDISTAALSVQTDRIRLHFYGWEADEDSLFTVSFPDNTSEYGRVLLGYKMCGWNQGPAEWDMTTMIKIHDKANDQWLEFVRAITPYGGSFGANWEKTFYIDVTEFLPLLKGEAEFRIFYCGWDASATRAHAVELTFLFFEEDNRYGTPAGWQKVYDSTLPNDGGNGYRAWSYGVEGWSIEDASRLGQRTIDVPEGTKQVLLRVCITGHGQDAYNETAERKSIFPNRTPSAATNCAEFDHNRYEVWLNGEKLDQQGDIWELNTGIHNYRQAGTYQYARAGWGPGKPCNIHHWLISGLSSKGTQLTLDFNLDDYISPCTKPNDDKVACYYVMTDAFFYQ